MNSSTSPNPTCKGRSDSVDFTTVIPALDALVGEVNIEPLMAALIRIVLENTGAQKGFLILNRNGQLFIEADMAVVGQSILVETSNQLPMSVIHDVTKTQKNLVLGHAVNEGNFTTDPYISQHQSKSILCAPICGQGQLIGLFYLENNLTIGAFTSERAQLLRFLCWQAAITFKDFEIQFRQRDGSVRWGLFGIRLDAEADCFEGVLTDISDRKHLEEELLHSQRFLDSIVENIPTSLFAKDVNNDFRNVLWNKTCEKMFGIPREEALA